VTSPSPAGHKRRAEWNRRRSRRRTAARGWCVAAAHLLRNRQVEVQPARAAAMAVTSSQCQCSACRGSSCGFLSVGCVERIGEVTDRSRRSRLSFGHSVALPTSPDALGTLSAACCGVSVSRPAVVVRDRSRRTNRALQALQQRRERARVELQPLPEPSDGDMLSPTAQSPGTADR